jgi:hypothetical protein
MSTWVIISWVSVAILTGVNIFIFLKLKGASEQMLKMAFPNAKSMDEAMGQMQSMMSGMGGMGGRRPPINIDHPLLRGTGSRVKAQKSAADPKLAAAMEMLKKMQSPGAAKK